MTSVFVGDNLLSQTEHTRDFGACGRCGSMPIVQIDRGGVHSGSGLSSIRALCASCDASTPWYTDPSSLGIGLDEWDKVLDYWKCII